MNFLSSRLMPLVNGEVKISSPINFTMPTSSPRRASCISRPYKSSATYGSTASSYLRSSQLRATSLDRTSVRETGFYRNELCSSRPTCTYQSSASNRSLFGISNGISSLENSRRETSDVTSSTLSRSTLLNNSSALRHTNFSTRKGSYHNISSGSPILTNYKPLHDSHLETKKYDHRSNSYSSNHVSYGSLNSLPETSSLNNSALSSPLKISSLTGTSGISTYPLLHKSELDENLNRHASLRIRYDANHNVVPKNSSAENDKSNPTTSYVPRHLNHQSSSSSSSPASSTDDVSDYSVYRTWRGSLLTGTTSGYSSSENASTSSTFSSRRMSKDNLSKGGLLGLKNLGNTCFMNSVLQCLSNTKPLLEYCLKDSYLNDINDTISSMKGALFKAFANLMHSLWKGNADAAVNPQSFKSQIQKFAPRFMGYSQQDAQEFLRYLLQGLHEDVNRVLNKPKPITTEIEESLSESQKAVESWKRYLRIDDSKIVDIFVGQLKSTLNCTICGHSSVTFDPFWDLSLPIPKMVGQVKLQQCFELFTREEILDGDEKPTCSKCKTRRKCTKSMTIHKFPRILVLHLKRFSPTERYKTKLSTYVDLPVTSLDLSGYASNANKSQPCIYNLYAVSNHSGTIYSGHYTAYCKHPYTGEWHDFNDSRVSLLSTSSVVSPEAYVLFYELSNPSSHL